MAAAGFVCRSGQRQELEGIGVAVVAGEVPAADQGEAEAGEVDWWLQEDDGKRELPDWVIDRIVDI